MSVKQTGQNLIDYVLIISIICITTLGGTILYSTEIKRFFDQRQVDLNSSSHNVASSVTNTGTGNGHQGSNNSNTYGNQHTSNTLNTGQSATVNITLPNGQVLVLSNYPTDLKGLIETAGASGTTTILAQILSEFGKQLALSGEITPEANKEIQELSNLGFKMANGQRVIEKKVQELQQLSITERTGKTLKTEIVSLDTATGCDPCAVSSDTLVDLLANGEYTDPLKNYGQKSYYTEFYTKYTALTAKGLTWNSPHGVAFQVLSSQIIDTSKGFFNSWLTLNALENWDTHGVANNVLSTNQSSNMTTANSAGICGVGFGQATAITCK